jgi:hypothetical protein
LMIISSSKAEGFRLGFRFIRAHSISGFPGRTTYRRISCVTGRSIQCVAWKKVRNGQSIPSPVGHNFVFNRESITSRFRCGSLDSCQGPR